MSDKRKDRRAPSNFTVEYRLEGSETNYSCLATDISQSGMFLAIMPPPPIDTRLYLMFSLPGFTKLGPLKVIGRVVRIVSQGEGQVPGVGVAFDIIYADNRDAVRAFIRSILGPTLIARPSARPARPGVKYKLTFGGESVPVEEEEADTEEDRRRLVGFKGFSGARDTDVVSQVAWLKYAGLLGLAILILFVLWQAGRCAGAL
ncbi:MAG: PilZ domain-containing protein [Deltaproteobacteria bacterium]|nr:PilZ domain-containing protein [Deltaproteobacteria bacterium]